MVIYADTYLNLEGTGGHIGPFIPPKQAKIGRKMGFYGRNMSLHDHT